MEPRLIFAYALIALIIVCAGAAVAYARHNTRDRKVARQRAREAVRLGRR
jgi:hypothetical protein